MCIRDSLVTVKHIDLTQKFVIFVHKTNVKLVFPLRSLRITLGITYFMYIVMCICILVLSLKNLSRYNLVRPVVFAVLLIYLFRKFTASGYKHVLSFVGYAHQYNWSCLVGIRFFNKSGLARSCSVKWSHNFHCSAWKKYRKWGLVSSTEYRKLNSCL